MSPSPTSPAAADAPALDPGRARDAFALVPSAVTVVTARGADGPAGCTASAVIPVSLRPPSLLVSLGEDSSTLSVLLAAGSFAVNVLTWEDRGLAHRFATGSAADRFAGLEVREVGGVPALPRCAALLVCEIREHRPCLDHVLVVGSVVRAEGGTAPATVLRERAHHPVPRRDDPV
ncbi:flavin reductase (DIM6/NTAB) family NADH-FMN oxidoreductase RutF [Nocardiopsis sp. Huas11]|uniref:flavin reductase family protein n=1 Tax=Nocardiopsis sp. Huas11 TaxID=2183912 RepID=UPI000EAC1B4B|nr:flavin reductase family protein [Nocardiopsis sp. Huas11]RKS08161.1 flavin reductase (DIM6/NTAB) family NADH-FMN oxidoreductase RutF [Nocardiopsis sp. Huas11]